MPCRRVLPPTRCALTAPFHPCRRPEGRLGGLLSVALSVGSRRPGVTWHPALWSPDFPPPPNDGSDCLADSDHDSTTRHMIRRLPKEPQMNTDEHRCCRDRAGGLSELRCWPPAGGSPHGHSPATLYKQIGLRIHSWSAFPAFNSSTRRQRSFDALPVGGRQPSVFIRVHLWFLILRIHGNTHSAQL